MTLPAASRPQTVRINPQRWLLQPLYFDRLSLEYPSTSVMLNPTPYTNGNAHLVVNTTAGNPSATITGGDPVADFGGGPFAAVFEDTTATGKQRRWFPCIVDTVTDPTVTFYPPPPETIVGARLWNRHEKVEGQHESEAGNRLMADSIFFAEPSSLAYGTAFTRVSGEHEWVSPTFLATSHIDYWRHYGGVPTNAHDWKDVRNIEWGARIMSELTWATDIACTEVGHGLNYTLPLKGLEGIFSVAMATYECEIGEPIQLELLVDGQSVHTETSYGAVRRVNIPFPSGEELEVRITSLSTNPVTIRIGDVIVAERPAQRRAIYENDRVLIIGDSWVSGDFPGFPERLQELVDPRIANEAVSGSNSDYPLEIVGGERRLETWLKQHEPTCVIFHSYINDVNQDKPAEQWVQNLFEIGNLCIYYGANPVFILPGCTGSFSQTQKLRVEYGLQIGLPSRRNETVVHGYSPELASQICWINQVGKFAGRVIYDLSTEEAFVAKGPLPADAWACISDNTVPDYVPT